MQFKYPQILYFLGLLVIPILIHLFQLQKFEKVTFTNVAFLKKLKLQTRKSSRLKKWLILATRLLLLTAIIIAFAQPYFSNTTKKNTKHFFIYLDNSLSLKSKGTKGDLLPIAAQEIIENSSNNSKYTLLTNTNFYRNIDSDQLKKELLNIKPSTQKTGIKNILLRAKDYNQNHPTSTIIISDFQNTKPVDFEHIPQNTSLVQILPEQKDNISIDSIALENTASNNLILQVFLKNQGAEKTEIPISLFNDKTLINKQSFSIDKNTDTQISFTIPKTNLFLGKIKLNIADTYDFDNTFYFTIEENDKIPVLAIGENNDFLNRIYTNDEFSFTSATEKSVNYATISKQQLIILNSLVDIPQALLTALINYSNDGGNLVIIPNTKSNINSYNSLFRGLKLGKINELKNDTLKITKIQYQHPIYKSVFKKEINNFQYPSIYKYYTSNFINSSAMLLLENQKAFIQQIKNKNASIFWVASSLDTKASNFTNSPLIVPTFYNIGILSLQHPKLFYRNGEENIIELNKQLGKDEIVNINTTNNSFIPLQRVFQNKVQLTTNEQPSNPGFYNIKQEEKTLKSIAFNVSALESKLNFLDLKSIDFKDQNIIISNEVKQTLEKINSDNKVHWLWQWFLILAIVSLLLEILILKFFKP